jgi:hypothetical protein
MVGVDILPIMFSFIPVSIMSGLLVTRYGRFRWALWSGWAIVTLASGLMLLWDVKTSTATWFMVEVILGVGQGLILNVLNFAAQASAHVDDAAFAAATYLFMRQFGMAIGVGVGSSVLQNVMKQKAKELGLPGEIATNAEGLIATLHTQTDLALRGEILKVYVAGLHGVYVLLTAMAAVGFLLSLLIKGVSLDQVLVSKHRLAIAYGANGIRSVEGNSATRRA